MKRPLLVAALSAIFLAALVISACQKTKYVPPPASVTVVHAMANETHSIASLFGAKQSLQYFSTMQKINRYASFLFSPVAGPTSIQVVPSTDTMFNILNINLTLLSGNMYTLFLAGDSTKPDTVLTTDNIPYYPFSDSVAGIRFINLVPDSKPVLVNLQGNDPTKVDEFTNIAYKQITAFKQYAATSSSPTSYKFEIRDQTSDSLLYTYTWSYPVLKNQTIVIAGSEVVGSPTPISVFPVNNY